MLARVILVFVAVCIPLHAGQLSPKDILVKNRDAVVQIFINGEFHGTGFIISEDGLIATANHVVTTKESGNTEFFPKIEIQVPNRPGAHFARPVLPVDDAARIHDTAILRIEVVSLPHVIFGDWNEIEQADAVTLIAYVPGIKESLIVTGMVSAKSQEDIFVVKPKTYRLRKILFQVPVRGGFSGSPVFSNTTGHVIGIETSKIFGISMQLDSVRKKLAGSQSVVELSGVSVGDTITNLIDTLDENLISGLGSAVDIVYAKEMQTKIQSTDKK